VLQFSLHADPGIGLIFHYEDLAKRSVYGIDDWAIHIALLYFKPLKAKAVFAATANSSALLKRWMAAAGRISNPVTRL
jgi:hypothetical protein